MPKGYPILIMSTTHKFVGHNWTGQTLTTRDISSHIKEIYGFGLSESMVTKITNKILPTIEEWQSRPLDKVYPMVYLDAIL